TSFRSESGEVEVEFSVDSAGFATDLAAESPRIRFVGRRFVPVRPTESELGPYLGRYYAPELDVVWTMILVNGGLAIRLPSRQAVPLDAAEHDAFETIRGLLHFTRDAAGNLTGFGFTAPRMRNIRFERVPSRSAP